VLATFHSVSGAIPFLMAAFVWLVTRFRAGRLLIFGEQQGMSVKEIMKAVKESQREASMR